MARSNNKLRAQKLKASKQVTSGCIQSGKYVEPYQQGINAYISGTAYEKGWHPHKQQGWRKARDEALKFYEQTGIETGALKKAA